MTNSMLDQLFSVAGKSILITGGSRGIGHMMARGLVACGAQVFITSRNENECLQAAQMIKEDAHGSDGDCVAIPCDLSTKSGIEHLALSLNNHVEGLQVLINNAGAAWGAPIDEYPQKGWDKVFDINLRGLFFLSQKLLPTLENAGSATDPARIINIASINGLTNPKLNNFAYAASKAGVIQLTRQMSVELAPRHINVNSISPGLFPSRMTSGLTAADKDFAAQIPLRRAGQFEDAAGVAIFLSSRASAWITGVNHIVDGGVVAAA